MLLSSCQPDECKEGELAPEATVKKYLTVRREGKREILAHAGRISHEMAKALAEAEYEKLNQIRNREKDRLNNDFDKTVKQLTDGQRGKKNEPVR